MSSYSEFADAMSRILQSGAANQAALTQQRGQIWGQTLANLGQMAADYPRTVAQAKDAQRRQQITEFQLKSAQAEQQGEKTVNDLLASFTTSPDGVRSIDRHRLSQAMAAKNVPLDIRARTFKGLDEIDASLKAFSAQRMDTAADLANALLQSHGADEDISPEAVHTLLAVTKGNSLADDDDVQRTLGMLAQGVSPRKALEGIRAMSPKYKAEKPENFTLSPGQVRYGPGGQVIATGPSKPESAEGFTLSPGQTRYGPQGEVVAQAEGKPASAANVGSFEDYVLRTYGDKPTPQQILAARKAYGQADNTGRTIVPVVIQTAEGPQLLNRQTGTTTPITGPSGSAIQPAPTADMRNREAGRALVGKSIAAIEDLSKRIITKIGPAQRAQAIARGAEAVFGTDPEFRTYQDARMALAGNLAVAQQGSRPSDADIKAIWLPLVPDAYRDTADSAKMKWNLIKTMSNTPQAAAPPDTAAPAGESRYDRYKRTGKP